MANFLVTIEGLVKDYRRSDLWGKAPMVRALDGVDLQLEAGQAWGLVGESGCGKSTMGKIIGRLETPTAGSIFFSGRNIATLRGDDLARYRRQIGMVFQDPQASLNPRYTVAETIGEPLRIHLRPSREELREKTLALIKSVGLERNVLSRYPHELSGGQRQRVGIARAIAIRPRLLIADEPVSSLDVSVRAQILNLLSDLREELSLSLILVSHDLVVVRFICDMVAVMYAGTIVETAETTALFSAPRHPYTRILLASVPRMGGEPPEEPLLSTDQRLAPVGAAILCPFSASCPQVSEICAGARPPLVMVAAGHHVACHRYRDGMVTA